jgi:hypothetical protein
MSIVSYLIPQRKLASSPDFYRHPDEYDPVLRHHLGLDSEIRVHPCPSVAKNTDPPSPR